MARDEVTKSKLVKLLQTISRGPATRIGLIPTQEAKVPAMALVVAFERPKVSLVSKAAAGADAIAVAPSKELASWGTLAQEAASKPLGLFVTGTSAPDVDQLNAYLGQAPDFVVISTTTAPVTLLANDKVGKIVSLDESYSPHQVRALGEMAIDAVLAEASQEKPSRVLTVHDMLHYRQVVDLVRRPVLVVADSRLSPETLPALRDMGIEGLLLTLDATVSEEQASERIAGYRQAIDALGKPIGRTRERAAALVPQVAPGRPVPEHEPEEEPDEE